MTDPRVPDAIRQRHTVRTIVRVAERQDCSVAVQHAGTTEASVTVLVGRTVIYLHTRATAETIGAIWNEAGIKAIRLPRGSRLALPRWDDAGGAEVGTIVHTRGRPPGGVFLETVDGRHPRLTVAIGDLSFQFLDMTAFTSVSRAFLSACEIGLQQLPRVDHRRSTPARNEPGLGGHAALRAVATFTAIGARRPASRLGLRKPVPRADQPPLPRQAPAPPSSSVPAPRTGHQPRRRH